MRQTRARVQGVCLWPPAAKHQKFCFNSALALAGKTGALNMTYPSPESLYDWRLIEPVCMSACVHLCGGLCAHPLQLNGMHFFFSFLTRIYISKTNFSFILFLWSGKQRQVMRQLLVEMPAAGVKWCSECERNYLRFLGIFKWLTCSTRLASVIFKTEGQESKTVP